MNDIRRNQIDEIIKQTEEVKSQIDRIITCLNSVKSCEIEAVQNEFHTDIEVDMMNANVDDIDCASVILDRVCNEIEKSLVLLVKAKR